MDSSVTFKPLTLRNSYTGSTVNRIPITRVSEQKRVEPMPAPYSAMTMKNNIIAYLGNNPPPPTQDEKDCLQRLFQQMLSGAVSLTRNNANPNAFLPIVDCNHIVYAVEDQNNVLHITNIYPFTPPAMP